MDDNIKKIHINGKDYDIISHKKLTNENLNDIKTPCFYSSYINENETIVNESFDTGNILFRGVNRIELYNDNNVKFVTSSNSTNNYSNSTFDFNTQGSDKVVIQFVYWISNNICSYDVAFIIRDSNVSANHGRSYMSTDGAFISIGKSRQSSTNFFSINKERTQMGSDYNLGLWCGCYVEINLKNKSINYRIYRLEDNVTLSEKNNISFISNLATNVNQIEFYGCVNNDIAFLDNLVITRYPGRCLITNSPESNFGLIVVKGNGENYTQKLFTADKQYTRKCINGSWQAWVQDKLTDTQYSIATQSYNGLMSSTDKKRLDESVSSITNINSNINSIQSNVTNINNRINEINEVTSESLNNLNSRVEENERVVSISLNDLNSRIGEIQTILESI